MPGTTLDIIDGITVHTGRSALVQIFSQFGKVAACWIPPADHRKTERAYVKFGTTSAAQAALDAADAGMIYNHGLMLKCEWGTAERRANDSRDFNAAGSNLMTSRDIFREAARQRKEQKEAKKSEKSSGKKGGRRGRSRSRGRSHNSRSPSRSRNRRRSRGRSSSRRGESRRRDKSAGRGGRGRGTGFGSGPPCPDERAQCALEDGRDRDQHQGNGRRPPSALGQASDFGGNQQGVEEISPAARDGSPDGAEEEDYEPGPTSALI
mmetsp:Transcript_110132/g.310510  ORF Transcript_110132/g.310510 Transcript_110132/m.310510 type:complete len:265 (-) Transcript_110132:77-871(-)